MPINDRCWGCYEVLDTENFYHPGCAQKLFGLRSTPSLNMTNFDFGQVAQDMVGQMSISGVQPKISMRLDKKTKSLLSAPQGGELILKPQNSRF
ncbi:MAG: hypothetical protein IPJ69_08475 [Deltaproteobacteria bacterium]|nr:MAG: hypothetical protein IPJ69_08475 [Deltaproteobacteria bacterium]